MPAQAIGDSSDHRFTERQYTPRGQRHIRTGNGERPHHNGVFVGRAYSTPVREGCDRDFPTNDTHTPNLLFHRQSLPHSPTRRLVLRTVSEAR
ncbi:hypothetical protein GCM10009800_00820 [Nocardiopsis rhodophaea]